MGPVTDCARLEHPCRTSIMPAYTHTHTCVHALSLLSSHSFSYAALIFIVLLSSVLRYQQTPPHYQFHFAERIYNLPRIRTTVPSLSLSFPTSIINEKRFLQRKGKHSAKSWLASSVSSAIAILSSRVVEGEEKSRK